MEEMSGFITHYLISGPLFTECTADKTDKNQIRYEQYLRSIVAERNKPAPSDESRINQARKQNSVRIGLTGLTTK